MFVVMIEAYGPFKRDARRPVLRKGRDFYLLKSKGTIYHVPKNVCKRD